MKRVNKILSLLLTVILLFLIPLPTAGAVTNRPVWEYDNSFVVTVETAVEQAFSWADFPEIDGIQDIEIMKKVQTETGYAYDIAVLLGVFGEDAVTQGMAAVQANPLVKAVSRNFYVSDYGERASFVVLNHSKLFLPTGGSAQLKISQVHLVEGQFTCLGTVITVDPETTTFDQVRETCELGNYWCVRQEDPSNYIKEKLIYLTTFTNEDDRKNAPSEIHRYFVQVTTPHRLCQLPGVTAELVYQQVPAALPPHEMWSSTNPSVASVALVNGSPAENVGHYGIVDSLVTVSANQVGSTDITVERGYGSISKTATCQITVYLPGDVNQNGKVDAADALQVLKHTVGKITLDEETVAYHAADFQTDNIIDTKDALHILKKVVQ